MTLVSIVIVKEVVESGTSCKITTLIEYALNCFKVLSFILQLLTDMALLALIETFSLSFPVIVTGSSKYNKSVYSSPLSPI